MIRFLETPIDIVPPGTIGNPGWLTIDLSGYVSKKATGVILHIVNKYTSAGWSFYYGFRRKGSTDNRTGIIGYNAHWWVACGIDSQKRVEIYPSGTSVMFLLVGYFENEAVFFDNGIKLNDPAMAPHEWLDYNISSHTGTDKAIGAILEVVNTYGGSNFNAGIRMNGSTANWTNVIPGNEHVAFFTGVDQNEIFEGYIGNQHYIEFYMLGYIKAGVEFYQNPTNIVPGSTVYADTTLPKRGAIVEVVTAAGDTYAIRNKGSTEDIYKRANHSFSVIQGDLKNQIEVKATNASLRYVATFHTEPPIKPNVTINRLTGIATIKDSGPATAGYKLYRSNGNIFELVTQVTTSATPHDWDISEHLTTGWYMIRAFDAGGEETVDSNYTYVYVESNAYTPESTITYNVQLDTLREIKTPVEAIFDSLREVLWDGNITAQFDTLRAVITNESVQLDTLRSVRWSGNEEILFDTLREIKYKIAETLTYTGQLPAGAELIIDLKEMTATVNGTNVLHLITGDFFQLDEGKNDIHYRDNSTARNLTLEVTKRSKFV